ncbi:MAG: hypothetical protein ACJAZ9_000254 [Neolewinella sp.]|jgi:hypothetical protein
MGVFVGMRGWERKTFWELSGLSGNFREFPGVSGKSREFPVFSFTISLI